MGPTATFVLLADSDDSAGPALLIVVVIVLLFFGATKLRKVRQALGVKSAGMVDSSGVNLATLFIPRNDTNTFSTAQRLRDEACARLVARANKAGLKVIEQRSQAHSPGVWFRLDYVLPAPRPELSLCASVAVDLERFDFHLYEHTFSIAVQVGAKVTKISGIIELDDRTVGDIHDYIMTPGRKLTVGNRVRQQPWEFWLPRNKVDRLQRDWLKFGLILGSVLVIAFFPKFGIFLLIASAIGLYVRSRLRRTYVLTSGKPHTDPRALLWMDSWQVSVGGLGTLAASFKEGLMARLGKGGPEGAAIATERIGYWGTDSWVEREQVVICHRRALGYVHVVPYGSVLYVAWECHLNSASWNEETLSSGIDKSTGLDVVANRVVAGHHKLNEYDVSDANFLSEWMHEAMKGEIKLRMAESKIDQEIDFTVQRESRKNALTTPAEGSGSTETSKVKRFLRLE